MHGLFQNWNNKQDYGSANTALINLNLKIQIKNHETQITAVRG